MKKHLLAIAIGLGVLCAAGSAEAQRPFFIGGGLGTALRLDHPPPTQMKIEFDFGWHVNGSPDGFFIGATVSHSITNRWFVFAPGFALGGDIAVHEGDLDVLLTPHGHVGLAWTDVAFGDQADEELAFNLYAAFDVKLRFADDKVTIFMRPIGIDHFIADRFGLRYDIMVGAFYNF